MRSVSTPPCILLSSVRKMVHVPAANFTTDLRVTIARELLSVSYRNISAQAPYGPEATRHFCAPKWTQAATHLPSCLAFGTPTLSDAMLRRLHLLHVQAQPVMRNRMVQGENGWLELTERVFNAVIILSLTGSEHAVDYWAGAVPSERSTRVLWQESM
jgi:hypothetical protein